MLEGLYEVSDDGVITLNVHAQPGAGRTEITGRHGQALKIRVAAPPEGGRANSALAKLLAESFGVAESKVELASGERSRQKRFRLMGIEGDDFARRLEQLAGGGNVRSARDVAARRGTPPRI